MSSNEQLKTEKQRTSTIRLVVASKYTSTQIQTTEFATATATAPMTLDACPDEILLNIAEFTGEYTCYLGYGRVNKRINQLFNTYSTKLSKTSSYGCYASFQEIVHECETRLKNEKDILYWGIHTDQLASGVINFNRTDLLEWAIEKQNKYIFHAICERAVQYRKLTIFQKVWDCITNENVMTYMKQQANLINVAAHNGHLDWLIYLREELECEWDIFACSSAASSGHLDCLIYLHEQGCEWNNGETCESAAIHGNLNCLKYLYEQGCPWNEVACSSAAYGGHLDCLVYLHEHGCEWDREASECAARNGQVDCLRYLHEQGCEWDSHACSGAAEKGHLDCLKYLHKHWCPWHNKACFYAACSGHFECLKYLHEHGCEWSNEACTEAACRGHLECLQYMQDNGLEWDQYDEYLGNKPKGSDP